MDEIARGYLKKYDWDQSKIKLFRETLLDWYDQNKRDLPWRQTKNPYFVWVSEIMLQQTQVQTVIPYYENFISKLPTVNDLATIDQESLYGLWQGLGYYSRVRNMQTAAQQIITDFNGQFPQDYKSLLTLKGIGPYTAAAIASIAFGEAKAAIDGNLMRVTARMFEIDADISQAKNRKIFEGILNELIDPKRPGDFNQALMDIGATIMTPANLNPELSPIKAFDASYHNGTAKLYPVKKRKIKLSHHFILGYFIYTNDKQWLMRKHSDQELLTNLWHFPLVEHEVSLEAATAQELIEPLHEWLQQELQTQTDFSEKVAETEASYFFETDDIWFEDSLELLTQIPEIKHVFSHRVWHVRLIPLKIKKAFKISDSNNELKWVNSTTINDLAVSTLQRKLMDTIFNDK